MKTDQQAAFLRFVRKIHRLFGISLFILFLFVAVTGFLLGWKKNLPSIQAPTSKGVAAELSDWLPMDVLVTIANKELISRYGPNIGTRLEKIDARPDKGIVKIIYSEHYHGFQIDAANGNILSDEMRRSDLIEHIHDGTWIDYKLNLPGGRFKLVYTTLMSVSLVTFCLSGFWLWYGPKSLRRQKRNM